MASVGLGRSGRQDPGGLGAGPRGVRPRRDRGCRGARGGKRGPRTRKAKVSWPRPPNLSLEPMVSASQRRRGRPRLFPRPLCGDSARAKAAFSGSEGRVPRVQSPTHSRAAPTFLERHDPNSRAGGSPSQSTSFLSVPKPEFPEPPEKGSLGSSLQIQIRLNIRVLLVETQ